MSIYFDLQRDHRKLEIKVEELEREVDRYREALKNLLATYLQRQNPWEPSVEAARRLVGGDLE